MSGKVIVWDFDGTLARRTGGGWAGALVELARLEGALAGVESEQVRPHLRQGYPWHTPERHHPELSEPDAWWSAMALVFAGVYTALGCEPSQAARLAARVRDHYLLPAAFEVFDDVEPVLTLLSRQGWQHINLSNHVPELPVLVERLGLADHFLAVVTSAVIGYEKPHRECYRAALAAAGSNEAVWMVGDDFEADVLGAERAGLRAILVRRDDARAQHCTPNLLGVPEIIGSAR